MSEIDDVQKCKTQLKTYIKLSQTMGVKFVINEKSRATIYRAMQFHKKSLDIAQLSTHCLKKLLLEIKDNTAKKKICQEYMKQYAVLMALVPAHCADREFALNICSLVMAMTDDNEINNQLNSKIGQLAPLHLLGHHIREAHKDDTDIKLLVGQTLEILGIQDDLEKRKSTYKRHRTMSETDLALTEAWANEVLVDDYDEIGLERRELEVKIDTQQSLMVFDAKREVDPELKKEVDMLEDIAENQNKEITKLRNKLQKLQADYMNLQISYEADKEIHATFMAGMKGSEEKQKQEIALLTSTNKDLTAKIAKHKELIKRLPQEIATAKADITDKAAQFEYMKTMVGSQMHEARDHYIKAISDFEHNRSMIANKTEEFNAKNNQYQTVQQHLQEKMRDIQSLQASIREVETNKQHLDARAENMQEEIRKMGNDLGEKLKHTQEELMKVRRDVGVSMHMRENFKKGVQELSTENNKLRHRLQSLKTANVSKDKGSKIEEKNKLEKENADMKSRLFDIMQKGGSSTSAMVENLKRENEKLRKEKDQLMQLTESLLNMKGGG